MSTACLSAKQKGELSYRLIIINFAISQALKKINNNNYVSNNLLGLTFHS